MDLGGGPGSSDLAAVSMRVIPPLVATLELLGGAQVVLGHKEATLLLAVSGSNARDRFPQ